MSFNRRTFLSSSSSLALGGGLVGVGGALGGGLITASLGAGCATTPPDEEGDVDANARPSHPLAGLTDFGGVLIKDAPQILERPATLIDFWASWCVPCRQSFRHLDQLYRTWLGRGLDMIGVSVDDDPVAARRFFSQFRPRFPVAWDSNAEVRERFGVVSLPTTVLLDGEGSTILRNVGFDIADHRYLEEQVRRLVENNEG